MYITALPCHLHAVFTMHFVYKATPTNLLICHDFSCHINKRETPTTCLTNHKSSISHHIMPLVINSLGGGHTHTCILTLWTKVISRNQSHAGLRMAHAWFNEPYKFHNKYIRMYVGCIVYHIIWSSLIFH